MPSKFCFSLSSLLVNPALIKPDGIMMIAPCTKSETLCTFIFRALCRYTRMFSTNGSLVSQDRRSRETWLFVMTVLHIICTTMLCCVVDIILPLIDLPVWLQNLYFSVIIFFSFLGGMDSSSILKFVTYYILFCSEPETFFMGNITISILR
jgi:hypothetical protein